MSAVGFQSREFLPGVIHIRDAMGVCMTLLAGRDRALLLDTGYGLEDVYAFVRTLIQRLYDDHFAGAAQRSAWRRPWRGCRCRKQTSRKPWRGWTGRFSTPGNGGIS